MRWVDVPKNSSGVQVGEGVVWLARVARGRGKEEPRMSESRMPTTLLSPVNRGEFRFLAVVASGTVWRWVDEDLVWVRDPEGASPDPEDTVPPLPVH